MTATLAPAAVRPATKAMPPPSQTAAEPGDALASRDPFVIDSDHSAADAALKVRLANDRIDVDMALSKGESPLRSPATESARLSVVRDLRKHIGPDDTFYFAVAFVERAAQQIVSELREQMRREADGAMQSIRHESGRAVAALHAAEQSFNACAAEVSGRLRATSRVVREELERDRTAAALALRTQFLAELRATGGELDQLSGEIKKLVPRVVRDELTNGCRTEFGLLRRNVKEAAHMLGETTMLARARTAMGRMRKLGEAVLMLPDNPMVAIVAAVVVAAVGVGVVAYLGIRLAA
ncbi:MAG: hypothetical protein H0U56_09085 [Methylibium sp.]|nr:hypothetical protein [Methylibium sp.]